FFILQRNRPEDVGLPPIEEYHGEPRDLPEMRDSSANIPPEPRGGAVRQVLTNRMVLLLALVYFLIKPARYALLAWGPKYINARLHTGMAESGLVSAMFELAGAPGALLAGYASDKFFGSRRVPVAVSCLLLLGVPL